jgi:hypothetical protein
VAGTAKMTESLIATTSDEIKLKQPIDIPVVVEVFSERTPA